MADDGVSVRGEARLLRTTPLLRGSFCDCNVAVLKTNRRRSICRSSGQNRCPRVEFHMDLRKKLREHTSAEQLLGEARPYYPRTVGFDLGPMGLQQRSAVVDFRRNCGRARGASDNISKMSQVRAFGGALGRPRGRMESAEDSEARKWP